MFDLSAEPAAIASALSNDRVLAPLVRARPGLRVPGGWDGFEIAVRAVLGQQIMLKGATMLAARVVAAGGAEIESSIVQPLLKRAFPRPEFFETRTLRALGITSVRASAIATIAMAVRADPQLLEPRRDLDEAIAQLRSLKGIGEWTAQYIAMRALGESDAFLAGDVAVQRKLAVAGRRPSAAQALARAQRWRPWRAYAVLHLWMSDANPHAGKINKEIGHAITA
jgi:AraC family transcriptional regulator of adaptative response / DNA-3-methyladenine glycosylase II